MWWFIGGFFAGGFVGLISMALLTAASDRDDYLEWLEDHHKTKQ